MIHQNIARFSVEQNTQLRSQHGKQAASPGKKIEEQPAQKETPEIQSIPFPAEHFHHNFSQIPVETALLPVQREKRNALLPTHAIVQRAAPPPITCTRIDAGFLSGGGNYFEHAYFSDNSMWSFKRHKQNFKYVYMDIREGPRKGEGFSTRDANAYKSKEMFNWIHANFPDLDDYWKAYRQKTAK